MVLLNFRLSEYVVICPTAVLVKCIRVNTEMMSQLLKMHSSRSFESYLEFAWQVVDVISEYTIAQLTNTSRNQRASGFVNFKGAFKVKHTCHPCIKHGNCGDLSQQRKLIYLLSLSCHSYLSHSDKLWYYYYCNNLFIIIIYFLQHCIVCHYVCLPASVACWTQRLWW